MKDTTPTLEEKVQMYERFLHRINMSVTCCDNETIKELVDNADRWSYMHRVGNGKLSDDEQQKLINKAFWKLCNTPASDARIKEAQEKYGKFSKHSNH